MNNEQTGTAPSGSRPPAPHVDPIIVNGVKYEAVWASSEGEVRAIREATGEVLWSTKLYSTPLVPGLEEDVQHRYINSFEYVAANNRLIVTNERMERFDVDCASGASTRLHVGETL